MRLLTCAVLLALAACDRSAATAEAPKSHCRLERFDGSRFTVCDPQGGRMMLFAAYPRERPLRSFAEVARKVDVGRVAFAMNAGMFDEEGRPIGSAIVDGQEVKRLNLKDGPGNFHLKPNGVFIVTGGGGAMIAASNAIPVFRQAPQLQTQSGPMLVIGNKLHPRLDHDGTSRLIRNGVGVRGGKALFVISEDPVSLGKFGRFFRDGLKAPNALYFDGSVSSLWDPANGRQDSHSPLGPIIVVFKPAASEPGRAAPATP
jgi:uncharacterized protein YigE (DUF2233 family)